MAKLEDMWVKEIYALEKNKYHIIFLIRWPQKHCADELICKAEREIQMSRTNLWTPRKGGSGVNWEIGVDVYTSLCTKQVTNESLLWSSMKLYSGLCGDLNVRKSRKDRCIHITDSFFCTEDTIVKQLQSNKKCEKNSKFTKKNM